jgi:cytochrome c
MKFDFLDIAIAAAAAVVFFLAGQASAEEADRIADAKGCTACHSLNKRVVGPSFKEVARKYSGKASAQAALERKVIEGGSGVWGPIPMPPHKGRVSDSEARILVQWVLAQ